ncbi:MAG: hypothetical protein EZS28_016814 [Streblomastix strix]|uniref:Uncharacterized protein n=1 Tax=Streblomastix strix TaxID=222440 RepID=A0A5J4VYD0_9EUKA|nr:MAG: hypothetical protein EZS28_016814 [Streblomastix strix]
MDVNHDHSKNVRQFSELGTPQTHAQRTNSSHAVDLTVAQLDLDVCHSDRQLAPTVATNALIQSTTPLPLVQGQLMQILEGVTGASLQETDFYAINISRLTTPAATLDNRRARLNILFASFRDMRAWYTYHLTHFGGQFDRIIDWYCLRTSPGPQPGSTRRYGENMTFFWDKRPFI